MNHAHLPWLQKGFPTHRPRGQVLVTERRSGQGLGPRGGAAPSLCPQGLLRAESALRHEPVIATSPSGMAFPLSEGGQPCDNTPLSLQGGPFLLIGRLVQLL